MDKSVYFILTLLMLSVNSYHLENTNEISVIKNSSDSYRNQTVQEENKNTTEDGKKVSEYKINSDKQKNNSSIAEIYEARNGENSEMSSYLSFSSTEVLNRNNPALVPKENTEISFTRQVIELDNVIEIMSNDSHHFKINNDKDEMHIVQDVSNAMQNIHVKNNDKDNVVILNNKQQTDHNAQNSFIGSHSIEVKPLENTIEHPMVIEEPKIEISTLILKTSTDLGFSSQGLIEVISDNSKSSLLENNNEDTSSGSYKNIFKPLGEILESSTNLLEVDDMLSKKESVYAKGDAIFPTAVERNEKVEDLMGDQPYDGEESTLNSKFSFEPLRENLESSTNFLEIENMLSNTKSVSAKEDDVIPTAVPIGESYDKLDNRFSDKILVLESSTNFREIEDLLPNKVTAIVDDVLSTAVPVEERNETLEELMSDQPFNSIRNTSYYEDSSVTEDIIGSSLAFVFDSTGSMQDELNQVKVGATQILAALLANKEIVIHNFILVPFNDPGVGPVSVTKEPKEFQMMIDEISVHGGGDCSEMSISGLKKALEVSRPNSYIYVFTDASAKDHFHQNEVLSLIQQLQAQVNIILTGTCDDENTINYGVYKSLAEAGSGQVFHLSKSEVGTVLKYVKGSLRTNKVNLLSLNRPAPLKNVPDKHSVVIDKTLKEFTVSVSGKNAGISVQDPKGVARSKDENVEPFITLKNVKIINVREPDAGTWQLSVDSDSEYSIRATGRSPVNFRHGFTSVLTEDMSETNLRPLQGASCFLVIQASDTNSVFNLTEVKIVGLNGKVLQTLPVSPHPSSPNTFSVADFSPPAEYFHLEIAGFGKDGFPIKRVTSTAISSSLPEKPKINMRDRIVGRVNTSIIITCHVTSLVPFTIVWFRDSRPITQSSSHPQTCTVELPIVNATESSEGNYTCQVKNIAGMDWKTSFLHVTGPPPFVRVDSQVNAIDGDFVDLPCNVTSSFHTSVRWAQLSTRSNYSGILHSVLRGKVFNNNSLILSNVSEADEGWYVCSAESRVGRGEARVFLQVRDPLRVIVSPSNISFIKGASLKLKCSASGRPMPTLQWRRDLIAISNDDQLSYVEEVNGQLHLLLEYLDEKSAGVYTCVAKNSDESVSGQSELFYTEKPKISALANNMMVRTGSQALLQCDSTGIPSPIITWKRNGLVLHADEHVQVINGTVTIDNVEITDAGEFTCIARNVAGETMDYIGLLVGVPPTFLQKPRDKKIQLGHNGTVFCTVTGSPPPDISWSRSNGDLDNSRMFAQPGGTLRITHAKVSDAGRFICTADNLFGNVSADVNVTVTGIVKPITDRSLNLSEIRVVMGGAVSLPCGVALGNPPGTVSWLLNGEFVADSNSSNVIDGRLEIPEALDSADGKYTCVVTNALGNASRTFQLDVLESPHIEENNSSENETIMAKLGEKIVLPCPATGNPPPKITWFSKHGPVKITATTYPDIKGNLVLENVGEEKNGIYTCTGTNELGSTSTQINLQVLVPPKITENVTREEEVVEGHVVVFNCQMYAVPAPQVLWYKDNTLLPSPAEDTSQILRFVATVEDSGTYRCVVTNSAGTASKEFNLNILVPPRIADPGDEPVHAKAGGLAILKCGVVGIPKPDILWRRHGSYMTENSTDVTLVDVSLLLNNVSEDAGGAYVCEAENLAGIAQQTFYLHVTFPPRIVEEEDANISSTVTLREGEEFSLPCLAVGSPRPEIQWTKDGEVLHPYLKGIVVMGDNTLMFVDLKGEHSGDYVCRATNSEGYAEKNLTLHIATPPVLLAEIPNRLEVSEGDSLRLTCPTTMSPNTIIHWIKDGRPLSSMLVERGDESPMKLTGDARHLVLAEAHPADSGNYSCVAVNSAGRTDATFSVYILMTPHFEEFNHIARRTVITGGSVNINCSVSGNPTPQVNWRKDSVSIAPGRPLGVVLSRDHQHLMIPNARVQHSGTYTCIATNKITSKEREFYITVLDPPSIDGGLTEDKEMMLGDQLSLHCPAAGEPTPEIMWYAEDCDGVRRPLNITDEFLKIDETIGNVSTLFSCEAVNTAGSAVKQFNVTVLAAPVIEDDVEQENLQVVEGENVSIQCKIRGLPRPEVSWLHNGIEVTSGRTKRSRRDVGSNETSDEDEPINDDMVVFLNLTDVSEDSQGVYTVVATNKAGFTEKHYHLKVSVPPKVLLNYASEVRVVVGRKAELICPIEAAPPSIFSWKHLSLENTDERIKFSETNNKLTIFNTTVTDAGNFTCSAANPAGNLTAIVILNILEPPRFPGGNDESVETIVSESISLNCSASGSPIPTISWLKGPQIFTKLTSAYLNFSNLNVDDSGTYTCIASNVAGAAEKVFNLNVYEPPILRDSAVFGENYQNVTLYRRFHLACPLSGHPQPEILWFKENELLTDVKIQYQILAGGRELVVLAAGPEHSGNYHCIAKNSVGTEKINFKVSVYISASWTFWSPWSSTCSVTCGLGVESRYRICSFGSGELDPRLLVDKSLCIGDDRERRPCYVQCVVDGGWSNWSPWSECSESCGDATRQRQRNCTNPVPSEGGKTCEGAFVEIERCNQKPCLLMWSQWSDCSKSCGGGERIRRRSNVNGLLTESEVETCNIQPCSTKGKWLPWTEWGPCSSSCGKGMMRRVRHCKASVIKEKRCKDKVQMEVCHSQPCSAKLQITGELNGKLIDSEIEADFSGDKMKARSALDAEATWFPYAPLLLAPVAWNTAVEKDSAANGYSLTGGQFLTQSDVSFVTGEGLRVRTEGRGIDDEGQLSVQIEVAGEAPFIEPSASVNIKSLQQDFVQVEDDVLMGLTEDRLKLNDREIPFYMNSSIKYDNLKGQMPYLVEEFRLTDIQSDQAVENQSLTFSAAASVSRKYDENICPTGFIHDERHVLCSDYDECLSDPCSEGKVCINTWGSYSCSCPNGYSNPDISDNSNRCVDVNECDQKPLRCHHSCINTDGSYYCSCAMGYLLHADTTTCIEEEEWEGSDDSSSENGKSEADQKTRIENNWPKYLKPKKSYLDPCLPGYAYENQLSDECTDIDECLETPNICGEDSLCLNTQGSFQCLDIPCPQGFSRQLPLTSCSAECSSGACRHGAIIAETIVFALLPLNASDVRPFEDLLKLTVRENNAVVRQKARLLEGNALRLRTVDYYSALYAPAPLKPRTLYRVVAEVSSFDQMEEFIYSTEFVVFVIVR